MRSRNVSPGSDVMRTLIQSERTRVPPVTAERSPPDSRMTGADSPVMADSSTDATPSMISPSPGMNSPAFDHDEVAFAQARSRTRSRSCRPAQTVRDGFRAGLAQRVGLRLAATFGHRFGEVGEDHREPQPERDLELEAKPRPPAMASSTNRTVVNTLPISTTNMTGFFAIVRGCSFAARRRSPASRFADPRWTLSVRVPLEHLSVGHQEVLDDWPQTGPGRRSAPRR